MKKEQVSMYVWLKRNNLLIKEFAAQVGCCPQTIRFVQQGKAVDKSIAIAIKIATHGEVDPEMTKRGRPYSYRQIHNTE